MTVRLQALLKKQFPFTANLESAEEEELPWRYFHDLTFVPELYQTSESIFSPLQYKSYESRMLLKLHVMDAFSSYYERQINTYIF